jgi:adenosine deaminase
VSAAEDDSLVDQLRARDITLDLCPTSNVQAGIVERISEHPLARLHRAGVSVTISTDDRTVTGTSLSEEMARAAVDLGLSPAELAAIALNAFDRAFAPASVIAPLRAEAAQSWDAWRMLAIS